MTKIVLLLVAMILFPTLHAEAEFYRWTDDEGVHHVTDDPSSVPDKYWEKGQVKKEEVKPAPAADKAVQPVLPGTPGETAEGREELYGDHPLNWWKSQFEELKSNISESEATLAREKNFIAVYEGGRGYGKIFSTEEVSQYESYKKDVGSIEEKLKNQRSELDELQRKATIYGVPRKIRE